MDALLAVVSPQAGEVSGATATAMLDRLWPESDRRDAIFTDRGVMLALSRAGQGSSLLEDPVVRCLQGVMTASRWDWPALLSPRSSPADWSDCLATLGPHAAPPPDLPACIAWLPSTQTLVAHRDALGEGPLWYASDGMRLAVASHPAPLFALSWVREEPDAVGMSLIGHGDSPGDLSPWRMVRRLPAGHRLVYHDGQFQVDRWWRLSATPAGRPLNDTEWFARARAALEGAVARRIPSAGAVGTQLSGGLDSTAVGLLAARALAVQNRQLHTFSHLPMVRWTPARAGDETPYVEAALSVMPNALPHSCTGREGEETRLDGRPLLAHDRSVRDCAREAGVRCMLSGWGGDEGVSYNGDGFLAGELLRLRILPALRWCWRFGGRYPRGMAGAFLNKVIRQQLGFLRPTAVHPDPALGSRREWIHGLPGATRGVALRGYRASRRLRAAASAHENQRRLLSSPHIANRIDSDAEWSIPAGFCFRYPLLDPEVIQIALQVPERLLVLDGRTRTLLREAMRGLYPPLIQNRHGKFVSHPQAPQFRPVE